MSMSNKKEIVPLFTLKELEMVLYGCASSSNDKAGKQVPLQPYLNQLLPYDLKLELDRSLTGTRYKVVCGQQVIQSNIQFGPYTGSIINPWELGSLENHEFVWEVFKEDQISHFIDGSTSPNNWMKYIRCARHQAEQNLAMAQLGEEIYYYTFRDIHPGEELLVWYDYCSYDLYMGMPLGLKSKVQRKDSDSYNTDGPSYACDRCGKLFSYEYYRDKHLKYTKCLDTGDGKYPCTQCDRSFDKRDRLRIHTLHVHDKHRPHECTVCKKRFSQSSSLNKHMRVHSGERPYKCPHCVKAFTASSILRTHIRQHSGERPFKCRHCGRAFASHAAHDSHVKRVH